MNEHSAREKGTPLVDAIREAYWNRGTAKELRHCYGCGEHYDAYEESHVGHEAAMTEHSELLRDAGALMQHDASNAAGRLAATFEAVASWLKNEALAWDFDFDKYEADHLHAYGRTPSDEFRDHCARIAVEYADGQHRHAFQVANAYFGINPIHPD